MSFYIYAYLIGPVCILFASTRFSSNFVASATVYPPLAASKGIPNDRRNPWRRPAFSTSPLLSVPFHPSLHFLFSPLLSSRVLIISGVRSVVSARASACTCGENATTRCLRGRSSTRRPSRACPAAAVSTSPPPLRTVYWLRWMHDVDVGVGVVGLPPLVGGGNAYKPGLPGLSLDFAAAAAAAVRGGGAPME